MCEDLVPDTHLLESRNSDSPTMDGRFRRTQLLCALRARSKKNSRGAANATAIVRRVPIRSQARDRLTLYQYPSAQLYASNTSSNMAATKTGRSLRAAHALNVLEPALSDQYLTQSRAVLRESQESRGNVVACKDVCVLAVANQVLKQTNRIAKARRGSHICIVML